jgi:competence protein ComEA
VKGLGPARRKGLAPYLRFDAARGGRTRPAQAGSVDPNRASARELDALPGVGPALAARIVEYRRAHGRFRGPSDLDRVPGVGSGLLRKLKARLRFE